MMKITHKFVVDQQIKNNIDFFNILPLDDEDKLESLEDQLGGDMNFKQGFVSLFFHYSFISSGPQRPLKRVVLLGQIQISTK